MILTPVVYVLSCRDARDARLYGPQGGVPWVLVYN